MKKTPIQKWLDKISQEEAEKIKKELEDLTLEELQEFRAKAKEAFIKYSPNESNHDEMTAFAQYERYLTDLREINKAINNKIKITIEVLTEQAQKALAEALDKIDYLINNQLETTENRRTTERKANKIYNILKEIKEIAE